MLAVLREHLIERHDAEITVLSRDPSPEYERLYRVRAIEDFHPTEATSWFRGFRRGDSREHLAAITDAVREADVLVLGGGRMFFDYRASFMRGNLAAYVQLSSLAHFLDTPVMLFALSVVSETNGTARDQVRYIAEGADIVTVRELPSSDNLAELGVDRERIHVLPDPTLGLPFLDPEVSYGLRSGAEWLADADERLSSLEIDAERPLVGVNVRDYAWRDGVEGQERSETQLAELLDGVVRSTGCGLLFIPQRTGEVAELDDRAMAKKVVARMQERAACRAIEDALTIWQALAIYRKTNALVSMRRHGLTFALTQQVPVVSIGMDENTDHLMSSLGLGENTVSLAPERLERSVETVRRVLETPADAHRSLFAHVGECAARTRTYADLLTEQLGLA